MPEGCSSETMLRKFPSLWRSPPYPLWIFRWVNLEKSQIFGIWTFRREEFWRKCESKVRDSFWIAGSFWLPVSKGLQSSTSRIFRFFEAMTRVAQCKQSESPIYLAGVVKETRFWQLTDDNISSHIWYRSIPARRLWRLQSIWSRIWGESRTRVLWKSMGRGAPLSSIL